MAFKSVMYTTLLVRDQDEALDFYAGKLGFAKRSDYDGPEGRFLTVGFDGQAVEVILWARASARDGARGERSLLDPGELFVESDDLRSDFEALRARGVEFVEAAPEDYPFGVRVTALDPDGNRVSLRQRPRRR